MHPVGTGPVALLEENGAAGRSASIEGDEVPRVELQEPGVSHLTTPEDNMSLTLSLTPTIPEAASTQSSPAVNTMMPGILETVRRADLDPPPHDTPPSITSEAARTQRSPDVNTGTPAIPVPEGSTDSAPPPLIWPPDEAVGPPIHLSPKLIRAPIVVGEPLELLPGEVLWHAKGQTSPMSAHALEGKMPLGEAHGRPPDFPDP